MVGLTTTVTPVKLSPAPWQVAQPLVIPLWFIGVPGPKAVVELWQVAQSVLVGMWPAPCGLGVTPTNTTPLVPTAWQVLHPLLIPVWFITPEFGPVLPFAWHSVHAWVVGMWLAGMPPVTLLLKDVVEPWQVEQSAVVAMCPAPCGRGVTPAKAMPVAPTAWQVAQPLVIPVWFIAVPENVVKLLLEWQLSHVALVGM